MNPRMTGVIGALALGALFARPALGRQALTLQQAVDLANQQGYQAQAAVATRDAARYRDRAFFARRLPQFTLGGTVPAYNRSIVQVVQPDGSTLFKPQDQTNASLTMTMAQQLPVAGGSFFVSSALSRLKVSGQNSFKTWSSTPVSF
ncbi:MAG TPA: hypothetical protein VFU23_01650, partial [Gemmatimonadales bacterium]|nr:hypothetical protein [Gemmatimonadales bacterium]